MAHELKRVSGVLLGAFLLAFSVWLAASVLNRPEVALELGVGSFGIVVLLSSRYVVRQLLAWLERRF